MNNLILLYIICIQIKQDVEIGSNVDSLDISDLSLQVPVYSESCAYNDQTGSDGLIDDDGDEEENHVHIYSDPPDPKIKGIVIAIYFSLFLFSSLFIIFNRL